MGNILELIGRDPPLFASDITKHEEELSAIVSLSRFLFIGGTGSIEQVVTREIFKREPKALHVVDISKNNVVESVRDMRNRSSNIKALRTFIL